MASNSYEIKQSRPNNVNNREMSKASLARLSDDLIWWILSFLPLWDRIRFRELSRVCRYTVLERQKRITIRPRFYPTGPLGDALLIEDHVPIKKSPLNGSLIMRPEFFRVLFKLCPNVTHLSFYNCEFIKCTICNEILLIVTELCPELRYISLDHFWVDFGSYWPEFVRYYQSVNVPLKIAWKHLGDNRLDSILEDVNDLTVNSYRGFHITQAYPNLRSLKVSASLGETLLGRDLGRLLLNSNIVHLDLGYLDKRDYRRLPYLPSVKTFKISTNLYPSDFSAMLVGVTNLVHLYVDFYFIFVSNKSLRDFIRSDKLRSLTIETTFLNGSSVTDSGMMRLVSNCPNLSILKIDFPTVLTEVFFNHLAGIANRRRFPRDHDLCFSCPGTDYHRIIRNVSIPRNLICRFLTLRPPIDDLHEFH